MDINMKTVLLGSANAGKTSLVRRFVENKFIDSNEFCNTIGGAFISKEVFSLNCGRVFLCIWDTAGEEKYESVTRTFYRKASAAIICYDVTNVKSWNRAKNWISELRQFEEKCIIYLCATKVDLIKDTLVKKAVAESTLSAYISGVNIRKHFETSSKSGENVDLMFRTIADDYMELNKDTIQEYPDTLQRQRNAQKSCCFRSLG